MMRSVFGKTFYDQRWSMGGFAVGLGVLNFFILYMYPSVADAASEMMSGLGESVAESLVGSMALIGTPEAYLSFQLFSFQPLYLAVFVIVETSGAVAGEERSKTFDLLLTRPVQRWRILCEKAAAILTGTVIITLATLVGAVAGAAVAGVEIGLVDLALSILNTLPFAIWLLGFGLFCSAVFRSRKTAALVATAVVVAGYMLNSLAEFVAELVAWSVISPMNYYGWGAPLLFRTKWDHIGILLAAGLIFFVLSIFAFQRRQITT
jgi:ABC-2 type transport system permease protein